MNLFFHELTHILLSLLVGFFIWKFFYKSISVFIVALLGGVLIDLDHLFDYFLAFGTKFNLMYFAKGFQFLKSDKIYIPLHSWEIVIISFLFFLFLSYLKNFINFTNFINFKTLNTILLVFSLSLFLHLSFDTISNELPISSYLLTKRFSVDFQMKNLVWPEHYQKHLLNRELIKFNN